ncbi:MAG: CRISPR-associated endonuclease Cas2 [Nostoc sp.]|jgi:CRISPR-associated protein Cas2|uniref:CRISPR-associated endonuclease Cas2 n=1 Tax=unclassified Nostoc TaxID=2593658 RepID=UPI002AD3719D|nr:MULTISPECIES: CRISPR-associated endonuclease Cas2 [unclassified Nostoc]MDZ7947478.1 CRISPR-associated endonuclease Cas2 [Nostoc sp. EfeVER01]MDZ7996044.1 CRISPR-associated endonuclease Cas2 [Nostoc sp. EspVER01]
MAEQKNCYLICYDIRSPKRWRKAYNLLQGYGERMQYSIFRSWLTMRSREKLRWELEKILAPEDSLLLIRLSNQCVVGIPSYNRPDAWSSQQEAYRIV